MAKVMIGLAIGAAVLGAKVMLHPSLPNTSEGQAKFYAEKLNATAPSPFGYHNTLTAAKADGATIELDVQQSPTSYRALPDSQAFKHGLAFGMCKEKVQSDFLAMGGAVRYVFTTPNGQVLKPVTVTSCPTQ